MLVGVERIAEAGVRRIAKPFAGGPGIVRPCDPVVDFFPSVLSDIVNEHPANARLNREGERIAQAQRPDGAVGARSRVVERIIRRDRAVRVDAQDFAEPVVERL